MKKNFIFLTLTIGLLFGSCRAKKESIEKEKEYVYIHDTITNDKVIIKTEKITDTLVVELPCNEKGELKDFSRKIKTNGGYVYVYSKNGKIFAEMHLDGTFNSTEKNKKVQLKYVYRDKEKKVYITKYIERWWLWGWFIVTILFIIYKIINFFKPKVI